MEINYNELLDFSNVEIKGDTSKVDEIIEYEEILFAISKSLKEYRKEKGFSQKELAKLLDVDQTMISKLESGEYNPTFKQLHKISRTLTNSSSLFIDILKNIIENISQIYHTTYSFTLYKEEYSNKKENNLLYMANYTDNLQGGFYGTEKSTSSLSIAG